MIEEAYKSEVPGNDVGATGHGLRSVHFRMRLFRVLLPIFAVMNSLALPAQVPGLSDAVAGMQGGSPGMASGVGAVPAKENDSHEVLPAESLGKDDLLEITVSYCPELTGKFRVGSDGKLALPLLRTPIPASGLTPSQVAVLIKEALTTEQIMAAPSVNVSVLEYRSRTVIVLGAVLHPLTFQATGETTLLDAIAMAGGFSPTVGSSILVTSKHATPQGGTETSTQTVPVQELLAKVSTTQNFILHGGEEIRVAEAGKIFVAGNVVHPGIYTMQGDQETTILKALALSQGLQSYSAATAYIYRRAVSGGELKEIPVPLSRILARKEHDVALLSDDILYIPDAKGKRMTARVLSQIAGFGQTAGTGLLIYK